MSLDLRLGNCPKWPGPNSFGFVYDVYVWHQKSYSHTIQPSIRFREIELNPFKMRSTNFGLLKIEAAGSQKSSDGNLF